VECRPTGFGTFAVVFTLRNEKFSFAKKGGKITSSVDSRIVIAARPGAFRVATNFTMRVGALCLAEHQYGCRLKNCVFIAANFRLGVPILVLPLKTAILDNQIIQNKKGWSKAL